MKHDCFGSWSVLLKSNARQGIAYYFFIKYRIPIGHFGFSESLGIFRAFESVLLDAQERGFYCNFPPIRL